MRLFCIGNGFDLNHGLKSSYLDFRDYLKENNLDLYKTLMDMYRLYDRELFIMNCEPYVNEKNAPLEDNIFWSDFENNLSKLDGYYMDTTISMLESQIEGIKYIDNDWRNDLFYENLDIYGQLQDEFMKWVELIESEVDKVNKKIAITYLTMKFLKTKMERQVALTFLLYLIILTH